MTRYTWIRRTSQRTVFPTHDPEGYPLPDVNLALPGALAFLPFGVALVIGGIVVRCYPSSFHSDKSRQGFWAMAAAGAALVLFSCVVAWCLHIRNKKRVAEWAAANPDAGRAFEARGGVKGVPRLVLPSARVQQPGTQQVVVVQQQQKATMAPGGYQPLAAQNPNHLQQQPVSEMGGGTTTVVTVISNGYFYRPEFRGQRLTPEQMAAGIFSPTALPAGAVYQQQQQQATMPLMYGQQNIAVGQPVASAGAFEVMSYGATKQVDEIATYDQALLPSTNTAAIPGFGLPM